jgi:glycosyltransferase involved in cell wall biosynthesis
VSAAFIVFGVELPWIYPLAFELAQHHPTVGISLGASRWPRRPRSWPFDDSTGRLSRENWLYPPGFNRTFATIFDRPIRARLNRAMRRLRREGAAAPYVIVPEPALLNYVADVDGSRLIYWNYDDYGLKKAVQEEALVSRATSILCSSLYQTNRFRERFPRKVDAIRHFPHGVHEAFINPEPDRPPDARTVCSVGRLTSRNDWTLIDEVVGRLPDVTFRFIGDVELVTRATSGERWRDSLRQVLARSNVQHVAGLKHCDTAPHYWRSAMNWVPYLSEQAFVKASCPLRLSDGLGSGRPIVSADVPECRLYPDWISIYQNADRAVATIRDLLDPSYVASRDAGAQVAFARRHTWASRARQLFRILAGEPFPEPAW